MPTDHEELSAKRRGPWRFVPLAVTLLLLGLIAYRFDGYHLLAQIDPLTLALALALALFLDTTVGAFKWWRVNLACGIDARFPEIWRLWVGLLPAASFAPFQSGHLLYAIALRNAKRLPTYTALECVAYDKALTLVGTIVLVGLGQLLAPAGHAFRHPLIAVGCVVLIVAFLSKRLILRFARRIPLVDRHSRLLHQPVSPLRELGLIAVATVYQSSDVVTMVLVCVGLGLPVEPVHVFGLFPIVLALSYLPISISGFGVRENLTAVVLGTSLTYDQAVASGLLVDLCEYIAPALFGLPWLAATMALLWPERGVSGRSDTTR